MSAVKTVGAPQPPPTPAEKVADRRLEGAARDFEAILVRSMLEQSGCFGKRDAYGDMAVSTLAGAVTAGRGLGLGEILRRALETHDQPSSLADDGRKR